MWNIYLHNDCKIEDLIKFGFRKSGSNYKLNIPLYKYKNTPVISAYFIANMSDKYIGYEI